jgi:hypothetical protein
VELRCSLITALAAVEEDGKCTYWFLLLTPFACAVPYEAEERRTLAARIAETWMQMIFGDGLFHADPHPANIIVLGPDEIGLIDFGMVGLLSQV